MDFAQARYFSSGFGRFSTPDPYNIVLEVKAEKDPEKAKAKLISYLTETQQWNRYTYVINNPLVFVDPSGEVFKLTGSADSNEKLLNLIKEMLGEKAAKNLTYEVTDEGEWIIDYKKGNGELAINGEFGVALEQIIDSEKVLTMKMTTDNLLGWGGAKTDLEGNSITTKISYDGVNTAELSFRGVKGTDGQDLKFTMSTLVAHELGHAWGFIQDKTGERLAKGYEGKAFLGAKMTTGLYDWKMLSAVDWGLV